MAKTREQKQKSIKGIEECLSKMKSLVFIDYYELKVKEINQLRSLLKGKSCQYLVAKKTLLAIVLKKLGLDINLDGIKGGVGLVFGFDSEVEPAKMVIKFAKEHEQLKIRGGLMGKGFIKAEIVETLAQLPGKQELIGQLAGTMRGPINGFVYVLKANLKSLLHILSSIKS